MAGVERASEQVNEPTGPTAKHAGGKPAGAASVILRLQRLAGNDAVGRMLGGAAPVVQREDGSAIASTLQSRAQQEIASARAGAAGSGQGPDSPPAAPDPAAMAAEKRRQRQAMAGTVQPPDTTAGHDRTQSAAASAKAEVQAPPSPVVTGKSSAAPEGPGGTDGAATEVANATQLSAAAAAQAAAVPPPEPPASATLPEPVAPVDAAGRAVPADPEADARAVALAGRLRELRVGAHAVRAQATQERGQAHRTQALLHAAAGGVAEAEAGVGKIQQHTAHRRAVADQARQALEVSKQKAESVASGAPQVSAQSDEGKAKSAPIAAESKQLAAENASKQPEDAEAAGKSAEQGNKLTKVGSDMGSIDEAIGATKTRAGQLAEEAAQAQQSNTATQGKISATEQELAKTESKAAELAGQNQAARAQLAGLAGGPAEQLAGADALDSRAQGLDDASARLELRIHAAQQSYAGGMASMPARVARRSVHPVQRAGYDDRAHYDPAGAVTRAVPSWLSGEEPESAQARAEHKAAEDARRRAELAEIDREAGGHFEQLSAADKAGIALRNTGRHLFSSVGATNFPRFIGNIARGFIDPRMSLMGIVQGFGMIASGGANLFSAAQWARDPVGNLLKSAADIATGVTIVLGSIAGLATAIAIILTAVAIVGSIFSFGAVGLALAPIIAFCGTVAATVAPWALEAAAIALTLHGLVFIKNLVDAATAQTAGELQNESDQMTEDATNAGNMALQIGMAKAMEAGGELLGGGHGAPGEGPVPESTVAEPAALPEPAAGPAPEAAPAPESAPAADVPASAGPELQPVDLPSGPAANDNAIPPPELQPVDLPSGPAANDNAIPPPELQPVDLPSGPAANDNALPQTEPQQQVLADTGTGGRSEPQGPDLRMIKGGQASADAPRAMAGENKPPSSTQTPTVEGPSQTTEPSRGGSERSGETRGPAEAEGPEPSRELTDDEKWQQMEAAMEAEAEPVDAEAEAQGEQDVAAEGGRREHAKQRRQQARQGDAGRQVGNPQEVIAKGRQFTDTDTGHTVHVLGDRVVIIGPNGEPVSQFTNTRANTQGRIDSGKWVPKP